MHNKTPIIQPVLLPLPFEKAFDYRLPEGHNVPLESGSYVLVPFGGRQVVGVVWGAPVETSLALNKIKPVIEVFDFPAMPEAHRTFLSWVARYIMSPLGSVLKLSISVREALEKPKKVSAFYLKKQDEWDDVQITQQRESVIEFMKSLQGRAMEATEIRLKCDVSQAVLKGMQKANILGYTSIEPSLEKQYEKADFARVSLNEAQKKAVEQCRKIQDAEAGSITLIDGVTGSGKTEVYFDLIEDCLNKNQQALVLLPEIALTQQIVQRFEKRFGQSPVLWHSNLTPAQRRDNWRFIASGQARVVIGARSALFLPYHDLGIVIIDEEHDPVYKQEEGVLYHARDMAVVRSKMTGTHLILASATPSLETLDNVELGKYHYVSLPSRYGEAVMPDIHLVDLRKDRPGKDEWISPTLANAMRETFARKEQSLIFLNRRGYAPLTLCGECGHRIECPNCTAWMTEHRRFHRLQCHHCGHLEPKPDICSECGSFDSLTACGPGVERMIEEVRSILPVAKIVVFSSDNMSDPEVLKNTLTQIQKGKFDVLVGTQMLAKGHHFPLLTTVGIIDADSGLSGGDLRASERSYQLLQQVSGRAGRDVKKGHVYIQTRQPDNKIIQALLSGDRQDFIDAEMAERERADMPPFTRLVSLILSSEDEGRVINYAKNMAMQAPTSDQFIIYGPAPAPLAKLRGRYRVRFLVKAAKTLNIQKTIRYWIDQMPKDKVIRIQVDVDPMSFL